MSKVSAKLRSIALGASLLPSTFGGMWMPRLPAQVIASHAKVNPAQPPHAYADELVKMGFGNKFTPPGADPDLILKVEIELSQFRDQPRDWGATQNPGTAFLNGVPDLLSPAYLAFQNHKFEAVISVETYYREHPMLGREIEATMLHHEGTHPIDQTSKAVKQVIENSPPISDVLQEPVMGFGPYLGRILADGDPVRAARMRSDLEAILNLKTHPQNDSFIAEYPLLTTERVAYLSEVFSTAVRSNTWKTLPANRIELYAAAYNLFGGIKLDPAKKDEVSAALLSPEGRAALKKFPSSRADSLNVAMTSAIRQIQTGLNQLTPAEQILYYEKVLPEDYGDVLEEIYGNPNGRTNLGLQASPNYGVAFAYHVIRSHYDNSDSWDQATYERLAKKVEPEVFLNVVKVAIQNGNMKAQTALYGTFAPRFGDQAAIQKADLLKQTIEARENAKGYKNTALTSSDLQQYFVSMQQSITALSNGAPTTVTSSAPPLPSGKEILAQTMQGRTAPISGSTELSTAYQAR